MATVSAYCKAVALEAVRKFSKWQEQNVSKDGGVPAYVYLHDNFTVTLGIIRDEDVVFTSDADEWKRFCTEVLNLQTPVQ